MQLEDERRHADQYKEQNEKVILVRPSSSQSERVEGVFGFTQLTFEKGY